MSAARGAVDADTDLVTILIGGNDSGYGLVARMCFWESSCQNLPYPGGGGMTYAQYLPFHIEGTVRSKLLATFEEARALAPNATIIALGYPLVTTSKRCFPGNSGPFVPGMPEDETIPGTTPSEINFIRRSGAHLNRVIASAAKEAGVHFVPVDRLFQPSRPQNASANEPTPDHLVCGTDPWIGWAAFNLVGEAAYHPTPAGHRAYAHAISDYLRKKGIDYQYGFFESGMPKNPPPSS
jgi:hypothetical protein